jgi:hypothetical protein
MRTSLGVQLQLAVAASVFLLLASYCGAARILTQATAPESGEGEFFSACVFVD